MVLHLTGLAFSVAPSGCATGWRRQCLCYYRPMHFWNCQN